VVSPNLYGASVTLLVKVPDYPDVALDDVKRSTVTIDTLILAFLTILSFSDTAFQQTLADL